MLFKNMNPDAIKNMQRQFDAAKNLGLSNKRFFDQAEAMKRNLFNPAIDVNRNLPTVRMARLMDAAGVESLSLRFNPVSGEECGKLPASA